MKYTLLKALVFAALLVWVYPVDCGTEAAKVCDDCIEGGVLCAAGKCKDGYRNLDGEPTGCKKCEESCKKCTGDAATD